MTNFTNRRTFRKKIVARPVTVPGQLGDGLGHLVYDAGNNLYYCRVGGAIQIVYNDRVPAQSGLLVDLGRDTVMGGEKPGIFKVLSTRSAAPGGEGNGIQVGYAPAIRYQWMAQGGGQDVLWVQQRQFMPLRVGPTTGTDMNISIYPGVVWSGLAEIAIANQTLSMTAHIPATSGEAALVLITLDSTGTLIATKGTEFTLASVTDDNDMLSNLPGVPEGTIYVSAAVRVYNTQVAIQETRTNTDIIDLRSMSYGPITVTRGHGGFYAYDKAIPFQISVSDTYHALHLVTAGDFTAGLLFGFTFFAGRAVDANITSEANGTGGKLRIVCSGVHGLATGDLVVLGNMNNAGHNKPTTITTDATNPTTEFLCNDITYISGAGASAGTVDIPAYLKAGIGYGGTYHLGFTIDGTAAAANKNWKFEVNENITPFDNLVSERTSSNTLASMTATGNIQISENDKIWLSGKNITDTSDYTIKNFNINLFRI